MVQLSVITVVVDVKGGGGGFSDKTETKPVLTITGRETIAHHLSRLVVPRIEAAGEETVMQYSGRGC